MSVTITDIGQRIVDTETLKESYDKWCKTNSVITEGQYNNLLKLYQKMEYTKPILKIRNLNKNLESRLIIFVKKMIDSSSMNVDQLINNGKKLTRNDITFNDYKHISIYLEKNIKLNKREMKFIKSKCSIQDLHKIGLKKYSEIRYYDLRRLLRYNPVISFKFMITDTNNIPANKCRILEYNSSYEYGIQESNACLNDEMYYLKFYDLMMVDFDSVSYTHLINNLEPFKNDYNFRIYKTKNGYHVFVVSEKIPYNSGNFVDLTKALRGDLMYCIYSRYNGYNIRLSPKIGYNEEISHVYVSDYGNGKVLEDNAILIELLDDKIQNFGKERSDDSLEPINSLYSELLDLEHRESLFNNKKYIEDLFKNCEINYTLIKTLAKEYINYIKKPQRYLEGTSDYYIAVDMNTNMHYICYRDILMLDIDNKDQVIDYSFLKEKMMSRSNSYAVYKSSRGYHIFVLDRRYQKDHEDTINYMIDFGCDTNYIICSYLRNFSIRLNKKTQDDEKYQLIEVIDKGNIDPVIIRLVHEHIIYSDLLWNILKF
jgi:hypothetical protein